LQPVRSKLRPTDKVKPFATCTYVHLFKVKFVQLPVGDVTDCADESRQSSNDVVSVLNLYTLFDKSVQSYVRL